ncbi:MAG: primosomal protein, partial [Pseudomonadota bacterium]
MSGAEPSAPTEADGLPLWVAVETPQHSGLTGPLAYRADRIWPPGTLLRVPLGRRDVLGVVWDPARVDEDPPDPATWREAG